jgi:hypothetical protein
LASLGTSRNRLGDRWQIADDTEKNPPKSAGCGISRKAPWADRWHFAEVTARFAIARNATVGKVETESWQNPPDLENQLLHLWMLYCTDRSFATGEF